MKDLRVLMLAFFSITFIYFEKTLAQTKASFTVSGEIEGASATDKVVLDIWPGYYHHRVLNSFPHDRVSCEITNRRFSLVFNKLDGPAYFNLLVVDTVTNKKIVLGAELIAEPGEAYHLKFKKNLSDNNKYEIASYSGLGATQFSFKKDVDSLTTKFRKLVPQDVAAFLSKEHPSLDSTNFLQIHGTDLKYYSNLLQAEILQLNKYKSSLNRSTFYIIDADLRGATGYQELSLIQNDLKKINSCKKNKPENKIAIDQKILDTYYGDCIKTCTPNETPTDLLMSSYQYLHFLEWKESVTIEPETRSGAKPYDKIKNHYAGLLREKLMTFYLVDVYQYNANSDSLITDAKQIVKDSKCLKALNLLIDNRAIGKQAYNFHLVDDHGKNVSLSDFKGKVVFMDFWYTGCGYCASFYKNILVDMEKQFNKEQVVFVTVNIDTDKNKWLSSIEKSNYCSPNNVNLNTGNLGTSHPIIRYYNVDGYPLGLVIGKDGKIVESRDQIIQNKTQLLNTLSASINQK